MRQTPQRHLWSRQWKETNTWLFKKLVSSTHYHHYHPGRNAELQPGMESQGVPGTVESGKAFRGELSPNWMPNCNQSPELWQAGLCPPGRWCTIFPRECDQPKRRTWSSCKKPMVYKRPRVQSFQSPSFSSSQNSDLGHSCPFLQRWAQLLDLLLTDRWAQSCCWLARHCEEFLAIIT